MTPPSRGLGASINPGAVLSRLPLTRAALAGGGIDAVKARAVAEAVAGLPAATATAVEARVITRAPTQTAAGLRAALRRAVLAADPAAAAARHATKTADRGVWREHLPDGMGRLEWLAPSEQIEAGHRRLTQLALTAQAADRARARAQRAAGAPPEHLDPVRTLDQARCDTLTDLLTGHPLARVSDGGPSDMSDGVSRGGDVARGRSHRGDRPAPQIQVVVAASTLLGADDEPAELVGAGPITAEVARRLAGEGVWRRLLTDPAGRPLEISTDTYQPPPWMRELVTTRDRTCQGPGCRMPAERCDLDHTMEWPCGPTCPANLVPLCRTHHRIKTLTDTTYRPDNDGGYRWTLPSGRTHVRDPEPALDHPALLRATPRLSATGPPGQGHPPDRGDPSSDPDPPPGDEDLPSNDADPPLGGKDIPPF